MIGEDLWDFDNFVHRSDGVEWNYETVVRGSDGCIYGISSRGKGIIKLNPIDDSVSIVGDDLRFKYIFNGGVLADDGNIYAVNQYRQILKIDTFNNEYTFIGSEIYNRNDYNWGSPVIGADKCIYFLPYGHDRVLKFNPSTQVISLVGESYRHIGDSYRANQCKWCGGALASDGYIYCISKNANHILQK